MFGRQGQAQSQNYAVDACVICSAQIKVSYFVFLFLGYRLYQVLASGASDIGFLLAEAFMEFLLLYLTVLVHEFGHGTMSRRLGGSIDHILLWPFGGICFSTRPEESDVRTIAKNDFKVVAAGPATHIPQTIGWALSGLALVAFLNTTPTCRDATAYGWRGDDVILYKGCFPCDGANCIVMFLDIFRSSAPAPVLYAESPGFYFLYSIPGMAIQLNILLFAFNVFLPMYPADGGKLMTSMLMHCCHVRPYKAAGILIVCSGFCSLALMGWALYSFQTAASNMFAGGGVGQPSSLFSGMLPGLLGLMAFYETWTIHQLRAQNRLSEHPYFRVARTDVVRTRDEHGLVSTLNRTGRDNPNQAFGNTSGVEDPGCCIGRCCCFWKQQQPATAREILVEDQQILDPDAARRMREDRSRFLNNLQQQR